MSNLRTLQTLWLKVAIGFDWSNLRMVWVGLVVGLEPGLPNLKTVRLMCVIELEQEDSDLKSV
jgi:hypothetical protein